MVATRGRVPKRSAELRRQNIPAPGDEITPAPAGTSAMPEPDESWHVIAHNFYVGLESSGQSVFYEQSDWDLAFLLADQMSRLLKPQFVGFVKGFDPRTGKNGDIPQFVARPMSHGDFTSILKAMSMLMVTEVDRRRTHVELERGEVEHGPTPEQAAIERAQAMVGLHSIPGGLAG